MSSHPNFEQIKQNIIDSQSDDTAIFDGEEVEIDQKFWCVKTEVNDDECSRKIQIELSSVQFKL